MSGRPLLAQRRASAMAAMSSSQFSSLTSSGATNWNHNPANAPSSPAVTLAAAQKCRRASQNANNKSSNYYSTKTTIEEAKKKDSTAEDGGLLSLHPTLVNRLAPNEKRQLERLASKMMEQTGGEDASAGEGGDGAGGDTAGATGKPREQTDQSVVAQEQTADDICADEDDDDEGEEDSSSSSGSRSGHSPSNDGSSGSGSRTTLGAQQHQHQDEHSIVGNNQLQLRTVNISSDVVQQEEQFECRQAQESLDGLEMVDDSPEETISITYEVYVQIQEKIILVVSKFRTFETDYNVLQFGLTCYILVSGIVAIMFNQQLMDADDSTRQSGGEPVLRVLSAFGRPGGSAEVPSTPAASGVSLTRRFGHEITLDEATTSSGTRRLQHLKNSTSLLARNSESSFRDERRTSRLSWDYEDLLSSSQNHARKLSTNSGNSSSSASSTSSSSSSSDSSSSSSDSSSSSSSSSDSSFSSSDFSFPEVTSSSKETTSTTSSSNSSSFSFVASLIQLNLVLFIDILWLKQMAAIYESFLIERVQTSCLDSISKLSVYLFSDAQALQMNLQMQQMSMCIRLFGQPITYALLWKAVSLVILNLTMTIMVPMLVARGQSATADDGSGGAGDGGGGGSSQGRLL
ncbi:unnamed protein product [Amoebophrya sp. A25]|nr:unnamed protein product [Amoebophrya sp. A25]|eukprot:GSA25T00012824001.1